MGIAAVSPGVQASRRCGGNREEIEPAQVPAEFWVN